MQVVTCFDDSAPEVSMSAFVEATLPMPLAPETLMLLLEGARTFQARMAGLAGGEELFKRVVSSSCAEEVSKLDKSELRLGWDVSPGRFKQWLCLPGAQLTHGRPLRAQEQSLQHPLSLHRLHLAGITPQNLRPVSA